MEKIVSDGMVKLENEFISFIAIPKVDGQFMCFNEANKRVYDRINSFSDYITEFNKWLERKEDEAYLKHQLWLKEHGIKSEM